MTEAEITAKYLAGLVRAADREILDLEAQLAERRKRRHYLHVTHLEIKRGFDMPLEAAKSEPIEEQPAAEQSKRTRRRGRQQDPHTQTIIKAIEAFMFKAGKPVHRKELLRMLKETEGIFMDALDPMRTLSGYLSAYDQFVNASPGSGDWTLSEMANLKVGENEGEKEERLPDIVNLNVYKNETRKNGGNG